MSGFEIAGIVLGAWPLLEEGLKFYKARSKEVVHHEESMNDLILTLHYQHLRFRSSCERALASLVKDNELELLLDDPGEKQWRILLDAGLDEKLKRRLGKGFHLYIETTKSIVKSLTELHKVVGLAGSQRWYSVRRYSKPKWHRETWKTIKDCLKHSSHSELLATIDVANTRLETLLPIIAPEPVAMRTSKADINRWDLIRRSARSLYCALCSGWLCQCVAHAAQLQLEDRMTSVRGGHQFNVTLSSFCGQNSAVANNVSWKEVVITASDEDDANASQPATRVNFADIQVPNVSNTTLPIVEQHITGLCDTMLRAANDRDGKCIGFLSDAKRKHYIHLVRPPPSHLSRHVISLSELLQNNGRVIAPVPLSIELLDRYELALLLASSLLQLHATSWLSGRWSGQDIQFVPSKKDMHVRDCAFVARTFPPQALEQATKNPASPRQLVIANETIFALGVTLVELSILATLASRETDLDRVIPDLSDYQTAKRLASEIQRNNVREWNSVVDLCLRCGFHTPPDFDKKEFRQEYFECVVAPLHKLYDDARPDCS